MAEPALKIDSDNQSQRIQTQASNDNGSGASDGKVVSINDGGNANVGKVTPGQSFTIEINQDNVASNDSTNISDNITNERKPGDPVDPLPKSKHSKPNKDKKIDTPGVKRLQPWSGDDTVGGLSEPQNPLAGGQKEVPGSPDQLRTPEEEQKAAEDMSEHSQMKDPEQSQMGQEMKARDEQKQPKGKRQKQIKKAEGELKKVTKGIRSIKKSMRPLEALLKAFKTASMALKIAMLFFLILAFIGVIVWIASCLYVPHIMQWSWRIIQRLVKKNSDIKKKIKETEKKLNHDKKKLKDPLKRKRTIHATLNKLNTSSQAFYQGRAGYKSKAKNSK